MKGAKKHFSRALTLLLSVLIMLQTVTVPAFAAENTTENVEVATNDASTEEESTFNLIKADVQIDDEYGNETDYISEVQIPDLEQLSEETLVENGVSIYSDYPGDAMVYLTQRWLNQEYGDVPGFGYVTEDGRTGWDTVYGLTRALQVELGITDLADNFGPTTARLYSQNLLRRQDGVTNRKFAILQGALWCKGYNPGYNLSETEDGTVVFNGVFDADVEKAIIELKEDAGLINPDGVVTVNIMKALMSMDSFKLLSSYGGTEAVREMQQKLNRKYEAYTGITPCDGVYGRNTNRALIYALQAEEGMPTDVANANFGVTTRLCCPEIPYIRDSVAARRYPGTSSGSYYSAAQITSITELMQFALLVNGYDNVQKYCSPKIVELNSGKMLMVYIDDVSSRSDENRTVLMYSIYDGTSWSAAKPIFDDGTMDYAPIMCADGNGGAHIVWQNAKKEFGTDVTLDEMSTNMELYYTHWDGEAFSGTVALTSNLDYETNCSLTSNGNDVTVVWQQNSENDPFSVEGTNSIHRKQLVGGKWQSEETIASNLPIVNSIACSYIGNNSVVAYSAKTNTDMSSVDDMEVYYYGDGELSRVTENSTSDTSVYFMDDKLYWMGDHAIMCMTGGSAATVETVVDNLPESVSTFKVLKSANGQKAIVWEDVNEKAQFYGTYYNEVLDKFGNILPLTTGDDVIRGWDACMMSTGNIQLTYCAADALSEPENGKAYGQLDLIQKEAEAFCDVSVNPIVTYSGEVTGGETIVLSADVYNNGSVDVSAFDIEVIDPQGNVVDSRTLNETLNIGGSANLEIPFELPKTISRANYSLRITPHGDTDVRPTDNEASFEIGLADIAIENVQESMTDTGRQLQITVANRGYETIDAAKLVVYSDNDQGAVLADINIAALDAGEEVVLSYDIAETSLGSDPLQPNLYHLVVETDADEANYGNNEKDVSVHAKCVISLSSGNGGTVRGTGSYSYGSTVTISAIPDEGYMFEGWYENGRCLDNISDEYTFTAFTNRTIEAKFVPNDLTISNVEVIGDMEPETELVFSVKAEGGYQPYVWEYTIYKGDTLYYTLSDSTFDYLEWSPTETGNYTIVVCVTDKTGFRATYSEQFSII